ncbi:MAG TPA: phospholipase D-like domain-containing protein [Anaerolineales bacterium]|nr:phospholipase D-like domain-containing protein [Anaerolineales bacterium]
MKKIILPFILITLIVAACEPLPTTPQFVTQIPFYASQTPEFIIPVTDTPIVSEPFTETPAFIVPVTETPTPEFIIPVPETPTPVPLAGWWEVYFTDPLAINNPDAFAGSIEEKLIQWINAAQVSIHIASFEFNLTPVAEALIAAKNRGVDVKWITDDEYGLKIDSEPERRQFSLLMGAGIEVKDDAGREAFMHNKFWIFDQQAVWTGSTNITVNGIFKQNNNVIVLRSPEIAYIYEREFQELWSGQFGPRAPSTISNQWAILDTTPVQVLFSSEDNAMSSLLAVVNDAKFSIRFLAFSFTDDALAQTMIERFKAGVDVQGVYETLASTSIYSDLKTFWCAGVPVRQDGNGSLMHNKVIIVDNSTVITGSLNFTAGANEKNEENVIIIDNPEIAALYLQEYAKIWSLAHDVEAGTFTCQ